MSSATKVVHYSNCLFKLIDFKQCISRKSAMATYFKKFKMCLRYFNKNEMSLGIDKKKKWKDYEQNVTKHNFHLTMRPINN